MGGLESLRFILRTIIVIAFHKLHVHWQILDTKTHRHLNIKDFVFLNP